MPRWRLRSSEEKKEYPPERVEVVNFVRQYGLRIVPLRSNKAPIPDDWTNPAVYEPNQELWLQQYLEGVHYLGLICGVKCANGYYFLVWDADNKPAYEVAKPFENRTTVVKSGGEKLKKTDMVGKEISRHFYFFSKTLPRTRRTHDKLEGGLEFDFQSKGAQVCLPTMIHPDTKRSYVWLNKVAPMIWDGDIWFDFQQMMRQKFGKEEEPEKVDVAALLEGVEKGSRDLAGIQLATWYRTQNKTQEETFALLFEWNKKNNPPMGDEPGDVEAEQWIRAKIESAWRGEEPYHWKFIVNEIYTDEERKEVQRLIDNPEQIPYYIFRATSDVVGEEKNRIVIVVLTFGEESVEVSGRSAGGKNKLVDSCMLCLSPSMKDAIVKKIGGLSPKSLRHLKDQPQTLYITERKGFESSLDENSAEYDIKVDISEHKITFLFVNKETLETEEREVHIGSFIFTTTEVATTGELANRIFNLSIDDSTDQNEAVVLFKLDQASKFPDERVDTSKEKKVLRLLFKTMRELDLRNEDFIIPWANELRSLLPKNETAIRRHSDKLLSTIYSFAKLMHKKLPTIERAGKIRYVVTPNIFWYVFEIADEAIFMQIVGMNRTQMNYWAILQEMFRTQEVVSTQDFIKKTRRAHQTVSKVFDFFEGNGLIATRTEGRERVAELLTVRQDALQTAHGILAQSDLDSAYRKWLENHPLRESEDRVTLIDPFTGSVSGELRGDSKFTINFNPVKQKQIGEAPSADKSASPKSLGDFKDLAAKS